MLIVLRADLDYFSHVTRDHPFQDSGLFYRFTEDAKTGGVATDESGKKVRPYYHIGEKYGLTRKLTGTLFSAPGRAAIERCI